MKNFFKRIIQFYLKLLTKFTLWRHKPLIVAIAGTADKTFVKNQILKQVGEDKKKIRGNPRSFNTEIGLPLAVLYLPSGYSSIFKWVDILMSGTTISFFSRQFPKILVLELGVDRRGDMKYLLSLVRPKIAVVTQIDKSFNQNKTTPEDITEEFKVLARNLPQDGALIINGDDPRVMKIEKETKAKVIVYGTKEFCQAQISQIREGAEGIEFKLSYNDKITMERIGQFGKNKEHSFTAAKVTAQEIKYLKDQEM